MIYSPPPLLQKRKIYFIDIAYSSHQTYGQSFEMFSRIHGYFYIINIYCCIHIFRTIFLYHGGYKILYSLALYIYMICTVLSDSSLYNCSVYYLKTVQVFPYINIILFRE